ncbi:unnamed protein product [Candidula unifasciata]|uniref:C2H2-type domain-containing protein n=1 Tax=Candidula unifasciata TaxID=100452 RepID=A0A8S3YMQ1_9EUPU|nr:unnamed protein product [Candidula unifasciata]
MSDNDTQTLLSPVDTVTLCTMSAIDIDQTTTKEKTPQRCSPTAAENQTNTGQEGEITDPCSSVEQSDAPKSSPGQSVIIIQNSSDVNMEEFEPSLLKCVKQVLAEAECQNSLMIINRSQDGGEPGEEQATYIIDLISLGKHAGSSKEGSKGSGSCVELTTSNSSEIVGAAQNTSSAFVENSANEDLPDSNPAADNELDSPNLLDFQEQVEISFVSCPSEMDLNNPTSESDLSIDIVSSQNVASSVSQHPHPSELTQATGKASGVKNVMEASHLSISSSALPHRPLAASAAASYPTSMSLSSLAASITTETSEASVFPQQESHISTQDHFQVTTNITERELSRGQLIIKQETRFEEVPSENVQLPDKNSPESLITMYFTSAGEFKETFERISIDTAAGIMQPVDEPSEIANIKAAAVASDDSGQKIQIHKPGAAISETNDWSEKFADRYTSVIPSVMSGRVLYRCAECGYCSHNKHYYKQHVDLVHNEDRPYKCPHCDYAGKRRHALLEHLVVHSNQRPFTCDHCNASFRKKGHLTNHIKLHTSQRLVHCGVCNIQLPDSEAFEAHLHKIHNTDKLYKCRLCEYTVVDREIMLKHLHEHNEAVMYSCPKCPSLFNDEENLVQHMKGNHHFSFVRKSSQRFGEANVLTGTLPQPASIICSECGFVCKDTDMMQQHMWTHIKKGSKLNLQTNDNTRVNSASKEGSLGTLGVLKMNVDLGQKTLPKDVVYQCSSCNFTSSDNSVFIKHMLAHKAQEKKQQSDVIGHVKFPGEDNQTAEALPNTSAQYTTKPVTYYSGKSNSQAKLDSGVPFIYDKASARFRCIICGYHCEFQRTIKAHIWKHSGHQSIEYPTFDHPGSTKTILGPTTNHIQAHRELSRHPEGVNHTGTNSTAGSTSDMSLSQNLPVLMTRSGDTVQLVPVNPLKANYKPGEIIQIKNNTVIFPSECGRNSAASRFLESIAFSNECSEGSQAKDGAVSQQSSKGHANIVASENQTVSRAIIKSLVCDNQPVKHQTSLVDTPLKIEINDQDDTTSSCDVEESCSEPGVVVEVMDTLPSGVGLTAMKSQQGSPRIPDLDGSCGERTLRALSERIPSVESDAGLLEAEKVVLEAGETRASQLQAVDSTRSQLSLPVRMRCPTCDCLLSEDFKVHLLSCQNKSVEAEVKTCDLEPNSESEHKQKVDLDDEDDIENQPGEDTDSLESSDEMTSSVASSGQPKSGICSSLLAVIEQLRERSRSESEEDKQLPAVSKKGSKKKIRQNEEEVDLMSIEDLQNIEKISENGGEKFRCSLCHYSSHRICNIKLHMKTHRQKKPSECSLCDFSSTSPEALQEHMLKHCKVRTYPCKFCPQSFNHKSTLRAHLRAHKDQEPFLCAYCVFETTNPLEYREHMQVHSGCSSRLRCPGCDLILSNKEELTAHLLMCKGGTKKSRFVDKMEMPDVSSEQDFERTENKSPLDEISTHHACVVPGCSFFSNNLKELQEHLSIHCNPSSLVCNLCDFKALHSRSLKSHMKRHANDQRYVQQPLEQYKCNLCGYVCHHLPSLKSHMWRHASDQSYSYEFTNDVINAAIDHDTRVDADGEADDPELLDRVINSERKILEGELSKYSRGDGKRPICWVTFRCCSCGFETINKAKLNIHMRSHSDIIQKALDIPRKSGNVQNKSVLSPLPTVKFTSKRSNISTDIPIIPQKLTKKE